MTKKNSEAKDKIQLEKVSYVDMQVDLTQEVEDEIRKVILEDDIDLYARDIEISPKKLRSVLTEKSSDWSYEKEWRLIQRVPSINKVSHIKYIVCKPKAIVLGSKCCDDDKIKIKNICEKNGIPIYRVFLSEESPKCKLILGEENALDAV